MKNENETSTVPGRDYETSIFHTILGGFGIGIIGLIGYPLFIATKGPQFIFIGLLIALASFASGFFLGTLFGMPKRINDATGHYSLNNSLVEIADWLTKIIVGLGLVNLKQVPAYLVSIGVFVRETSGRKEQSIEVYTTSIVLYFGIFALYTGYNYMRLVLSNKYKNADNFMLVDELIKKVENVTQEKNQVTEVLTNTLNKPKIPLENFDAVLATGRPEGKVTSKETINKMIEDAKLKLQQGLEANKKIDDPQKMQWGGKTTNNERQISATVKELTTSLYRIKCKITSTNPATHPLEEGELVLFALHNTYGVAPFRLVKVENGCAELDIYSYGSFTIGAFVDDGKTELEIDLAELPDVTEYFRTH